MWLVRMETVRALPQPSHCRTVPLIAHGQRVLSAHIASQWKIDCRFSVCIPLTGQRIRTRELPAAAESPRDGCLQAVAIGPPIVQVLRYRSKLRVEQMT